MSRDIALVWFPDYDNLWIETFRNIQYDIIIIIIYIYIMHFVGWVMWTGYQQYTERTM